MILLISPCILVTVSRLFFFFFFNDTATTEIYTLSLHDALPICRRRTPRRGGTRPRSARGSAANEEDRKSTRLNSSHPSISYAVFCLKKKKKEQEKLRNTDNDMHYDLASDREVVVSESKL